MQEGAELKLPPSPTPTGKQVKGKSRSAMPSSGLVLLGAPVYGLLVACFFVALLFGEQAWARGTAVEKAHWLLTQGICEAGQ